MDGTRKDRVALRSKVPWIPNYEEVLYRREVEDEHMYIPSANYGSMASDGVVEQNVRDAIHEENVLDANRAEGKSVHGHRLYGSF
jgi:hypothetical protein